MIIERELITPPLNGLILPGIVRHSILGIAREENQFKVTERKITMHELKKAIYENRVSSKQKELHSIQSLLIVSFCLLFL